MLTLSLVDIDRDEKGQPKAHFLIKRAVGMGGDTFKIDEGNMSIRFAGEDRWIRETDYNRERNWTHRISRLMEAAAYPALAAAGKASAYQDLGIPVPSALAEAARQTAALRYPDYLYHEQCRLEVLRAALPQDGRYRMLLARYDRGWYVPETRLLPLGDNRDNSRDGRYFGPVKQAKVLGQGAVKYWPLGRIGPIR
jgi:signal peptidase I